MRTPPALRGRYYPGWTTGGCCDYEWDPVTSLCSSYSFNRSKCLACHIDHSPCGKDTDEDKDFKITAQISKTAERHRIAVHQMEILTQCTVNDAEYKRLGGKE